MTKLSHQIALEKKSEKKKTGMTKGAFQNSEVTSQTGRFEILRMKY